MTKMDKRAEDREALERLLEIYGADRTRWPARERLRFAGVVGEDKVAARMLAEADALDRLLEQAPRASGADVDALKERIVAAALRSGAPQLAVVAGGKAAVGQARRSATKRGPAFAARFGHGQWPAAAMLAASLVLGVMLGSTGTLDTHDAAGGGGRRLRQHRDTDSSQLALGDDVDGQIGRGYAMSDATQPSRFSPRTLRWALMASLALNVLIIGAVAGTLCFSRLGTVRTERASRNRRCSRFAHTLPRERSDMIRQKFADAQPNMEALRKGIRDARAGARGAVMAEPFDQAKFNAALEASCRRKPT